MIASSVTVFSETGTIGQARRDAIGWLQGEQNSDGSWGAGRLKPSARDELLSTRGCVFVSGAEAYKQ